MVRYLILIAFLYSVKGCSQSSEDMEVYSIHYQASTRGFFLDIKLDKNNCALQKERGAQQTVSAVSELDWKRLQKEIWQLLKDYEHVGDMSPTYADRGVPVSLRIVGNNFEVSHQFIHGNPPKKLKPLVNLILSYSQ